MNTTMNHLWFPAAKEGTRPTPWWFYGRALFVSRHDYKKIFYKFLAVGLPLGLVGLFFHSKIAWVLAFTTGAIGLALLIVSLLGLYLQYGHFAHRYISKMLAMEALPADAVVADIHIGTYRHAYLLADVLPDAHIYTIDCKREPRFSEELAVREVQALETPPHHAQITTRYTNGFNVPLTENSCDAVVFGFGTHELPEPGRLKIFDEAKRVLRPGGKLYLFEHGIDPLNFLVFGPVIFHVTHARDWRKLLNAKFTNLKFARRFGVNLFSVVNDK